MAKSGDTISRQAAINAIDECYCGGEDSCGEPWIYKENAVEAIEMVERLPSAQPEIVRCKDCRYYNSEEKECLDLMGHGRRWEEDDFCSYAERREETT